MKVKKPPQLLTWGSGWGTDGCKQTRRRHRCDQLMWETWCCLLTFYKHSLHHHGPFQNWRVKKKRFLSTNSGDIIIYFTCNKCRSCHSNRLFIFTWIKTNFGTFFISLSNKVERGWMYFGNPYLCPDSWAMVNAKPRPVSSLMVQLRYLLHIPLIGANPAKAVIDFCFCNL